MQTEIWPNGGSKTRALPSALEVLWAWRLAYAAKRDAERAGMPVELLEAEWRGALNYARQWRDLGTLLDITRAAVREWQSNRFQPRAAGKFYRRVEAP